MDYLPLASVRAIVVLVKVKKLVVRCFAGGLQNSPPLNNGCVETRVWIVPREGLA